MIQHAATKIIASAVAATGAMVGAAAGDLLEQHPISFATVLAVGGVVLPATWWLSSKLTKVDDRLDQLENEVKTLPCRECDYSKKRK